MHTLRLPPAGTVEKTAQKKVGFVVPAWTPGEEVFNPGIPFRSVSVAGALLLAGYEVLYYEQKSYRSPLNARLEEFLGSLEDVEVVILWLNDLSPFVQLENTFRLTERIKQRNPKIRIVVGGSVVGVCPPEKLDFDSPVDYWIRDYGEEACCDLLEILFVEPESNLSKKNIPGLCWREGNVLHSNPVQRRPRFKGDHNLLYRLLDLEPYVQEGGIFGNRDRTFILGSGRGCAKGCTFCYWRGFIPSLLPADDIVDLASFIREQYGVRQFHIADLDFFANRKRPMQLARRWREVLPDSHWFALCTPQDGVRLSDEDWDLLASGGCRKLELGAESGSDQILRIVGKTHRAEEVLDLVAKMLARKITPMVNFVFGLTKETESDRQASLSLIRRIERMAPNHIHFTFRLYQPLWATPMGDEAIAASPGYPTNLKEVLAFRPSYADVDQRTMPWLSERDEKRVKILTHHLLPMAYIPLRFRSPFQTMLYGTLRMMARARLNTSLAGHQVDRHLVERFLGNGVPSNYVA